jgi:Fur family transcriptional regulator, iron response regulator
MENYITLLREHGIQPTPQRLAVAAYVLDCTSHPTAEEVLARVRKACPTVSRATVYNTLNLFVDKRLLRPQILKEGTVGFDPNIKAHHHFVDESTGRVYDIPWDALKVTGEQALKGFEVREFHVVMRGRRKQTR